MLHGILGSGANFRTFARALASACPEWGAVLVDLRMHGQSQAAPPPHTVQAAAQDLSRLAEAARLPMAGICGHSFGGKVGIVSAAQGAACGRRLEQLWVLDSSPGALPAARPRSDALSALAALRALPQPVASRDAFAAFLAGRGYGRAVIDWLAMNLRRAPDGLRLRLDLEALDALLEDYFLLDAWPLLEAEELPAEQVRFVLGGRSTVVSPEERARMAALASRRAGRVHVHVLEGAGHWLHADDPQGLLLAMQAGLCGAGTP